MAKLLLLTIDNFEENFQKEKIGIDYIKQFNELKILNILNYIPDFYSYPLFSFSGKLKNVVRIIKKINSIKPTHLFVMVTSTKFKEEIILFIILYFIKKVNLVYLENAPLPKLLIKKRNILNQNISDIFWYQFNPRICFLISYLFKISTNKKIIYGRIKKSSKLRKNSFELIIPARDADRFLEESNSLVNSEEQITFLDEMFVNHPDMKIVKDNTMRKYVKNYDNNIFYFDEINNCLEIIKQKLKLPIDISLHPKHNYLEASKKFRFNISKSTTLQAVSKSKLVIAHSSTSINFAILLKKPIILYESEAHKYSSYHRDLIRAFQRELGLKLLNKGTILNFDFTKICIDTEKYQDYIEKNLLPRGLMLPSYKIINNFINKKNNFN